jgi:hypothetical protein
MCPVLPELLLLGLRDHHDHVLITAMSTSVSVIPDSMMAVVSSQWVFPSCKYDGDRGEGGA